MVSTFQDNTYIYNIYNVHIIYYNTRYIIYILKDINPSSVVGRQPSPSLDFLLAIDHNWPAPGTFRGKRLQLYTFREQVAPPFGIALLISFIYHVSCPVASSLALAVPAVLQQQQLLTSPYAGYHPRTSSCFFSSRLQHFHYCSASQRQRRHHTPDSRAATFRGRKRTAAPTRPLTRTIVQNNTSVLLLYNIYWYTYNIL